MGKVGKFVSKLLSKLVSKLVSKQVSKLVSNELGHLEEFKPFLAVAGSSVCRNVCPYVSELRGLCFL